MARHHSGCTCTDCETRREARIDRANKKAKNAIAYARYVEACQQAERDYKEAVKLARATYEREKEHAETHD